MLTQKDIEEIEELLDKKFDEKLKPLPTKDQFSKRMDELVGLLKKTDEAQELHQGQHNRHDEEHERIRKHLKLPALA